MSSALDVPATALTTTAFTAGDLRMHPDDEIVVLLAKLEAECTRRRQRSEAIRDIHCGLLLMMQATTVGLEGAAECFAMAIEQLPCLEEDDDHSLGVILWSLRAECKYFVTRGDEEDDALEDTRRKCEAEAHASAKQALALWPAAGKRSLNQATLPARRGFCLKLVTGEEPVRTSPDVIGILILRLPHS